MHAIVFFSFYHCSAGGHRCKQTAVADKVAVVRHELLELGKHVDVLLGHEVPGLLEAADGRVIEAREHGHERAKVGNVAALVGDTDKHLDQSCALFQLGLHTNFRGRKVADLVEPVHHRRQIPRLV